MSERVISTKFQPYQRVQFMDHGKLVEGELRKFNPQTGRWIIADDEKFDTGFWSKQESEISEVT